VLDDLLIKPHDEDEAFEVEEELHRLEHLESALGKAAIQVVNEYDDAAVGLLPDEVPKRLAQGKKARVVERPWDTRIELLPTGFATGFESLVRVE
jgi:hypothetical protein